MKSKKSHESSTNETQTMISEEISLKKKKKSKGKKLKGGSD